MPAPHTSLSGESTRKTKEVRGKRVAKADGQRDYKSRHRKRPDIRRDCDPSYLILSFVVVKKRSETT